MIAIAISPNGRFDEVEDESVRIRLRLLQLRPALLIEFLYRHNILSLLAWLVSSSLLAQSRQFLQRRGSVLYIYGAVCDFLGVMQDTSDGLADGGECCGAEVAVAAIEQVDALVLEVHDEADHYPPILERSVADEGIGQSAEEASFARAD